MMRLPLLEELTLKLSGSHGSEVKQGAMAGLGAGLPRLRVANLQGARFQGRAEEELTCLLRCPALEATSLMDCEGLPRRE